MGVKVKVEVLVHGGGVMVILLASKMVALLYIEKKANKKTMKKK